MPWHDVQYLKITCRAGPFGGITCGRVGRGDNWPASVAADAQTTSATTPNAPKTRTPRWLTTALHHLERLEPPGARPDFVLVDPIQVQQAQQHVRGALRVVGEHEMTVPLERAVDSTDENHGHFLVRMAVRVAHVAALV